MSADSQTPSMCLLFIARASRSDNRRVNRCRRARRRTTSSDELDTGKTSMSGARSRRTNPLDALVCPIEQTQCGTMFAVEC
jgi:hypothetical protein